MYFAELDVNTSPVAQSDANGRFLFANVEPGDYMLPVRLPTLKEVLVYNLDRNANISVRVEKNKTTDIGIVNVVRPQ